MANTAIIRWTANTGGGKFLFDLLRRDQPAVLDQFGDRHVLGARHVAGTDACARLRGLAAEAVGRPGVDHREIERAIVAARDTNAGLIVTVSPLATIHRELIITLAARHKLPAVYFQRQFVDGGGLVSYGSNWVDQFRRAAAYVDRILRGEKPADLPVQAPTKYELIINLKTAKALGLVLPTPLLARADEIIE